MAAPSSPAGNPAGRWLRHPLLLGAGCLIAALAAAAVVGSQSHRLAAMFLAACGVLLCFADIASHRLPNRLMVITGAGITVLLAAASWWDDHWSALARGVLAAVVLGATFLVLAVLRPTGLGMGDVKLGAVLGLWLGWLSWSSVLLGVALAFVGGGLWSMTLLAMRRVQRDSHIAFGPWLLVGAAVATVVHERAPQALLALPW